jgi:glycosyltransferase involved in cell wall biosynthesis
MSSPMHHPSLTYPPIAIDLSILVPVYRSALVLPELHRRLLRALEPLGKSFEIILIEDCGGDDSWNVIQTLSRLDARVRGFRMSKNFGQHNALLCGIRQATGIYCITLDDDLQNPPEEIPRMLECIEHCGQDVVYGTPIKQQHGLLRDLASKVTKLALQNAMGADNASSISAFRIFRTRLREAFTQCDGPMVSVDVLLTWGTSRFTHIAVQQDERAEGVSGYTTKKLLTHALNMMTGFSTVPLQIASILGFIFSALGMITMAYVVINYAITGRTVPGFTFLASIISLFSGVQLFTLGIFGEYLARVHFKSMAKPSYLVSETSHHPDRD